MHHFNINLPPIVNSDAFRPDPPSGGNPFHSVAAQQTERNSLGCTPCSTPPAGLARERKMSWPPVKAALTPLSAALLAALPDGSSQSTSPTPTPTPDDLFNRVSFVIEAPEGITAVVSPKKRRTPSPPPSIVQVGTPKDLVQTPTTHEQGKFKTARPCDIITALPTSLPLVPVILLKNIGGLTESKKNDLLHEVTIMNYLKEQGVADITEVICSGEYQSQNKNRMKFGMLMPNYSDGTLQNLLEPNCSLTQLQHRTIQLRLLKTLAAIHKYKVIHRDIKPENIFMLQNDEEIKPYIGDFGLAVHAESPTDFNRRHSIGCTPLYAAPEYITLIASQRNNMLIAKNTTYALDVYSMGVIFYIMDQRAKGSKEDITTLVQTMPASYNFDVSTSFSLLIYQMITTNPSERISANAAYDQLQQIISKEACIEQEIIPEAERAYKQITGIARIRHAWEKFHIELTHEEDQEWKLIASQKRTDFWRIVRLEGAALQKPEIAAKAKTSCCAIA